MDDKIGVLISEEEVDNRIREMAVDLRKKYRGGSVHLIGILKGSIMFLATLSKYMTVPVTMDFIAVSSYGSGTVSSGEIKMKKDLDQDIEGRDVVIVEDILDSGRTLSHVVEYMKTKNPQSLKVVTLLDKPDRREFEVELEMTGFQIPDRFVVGYGLDYAEKYRNLPYIGVLD